MGKVVKVWGGGIGSRRTVTDMMHKGSLVDQLLKLGFSCLEIDLGF